MKKIEAFIRPEKLNMTRDSLQESGCECRFPTLVGVILVSE